MSKPNHKDPKNLDELLKELHSPSGDLDAFEKEALEGFAAFENEEEIKDLKAKLDSRIHSEVFAEKKKPLFIYWSAAAGVALLIGLIFLFKTPVTLEEKELALHKDVAPVEEIEGFKKESDHTLVETGKASEDNRPDEKKTSSSVTTMQSKPGSAAGQAMGASSEQKERVAIEKDAPSKAAEDLAMAEEEPSMKDDQNNQQAPVSPPADQLAGGAMPKPATKNEADKKTLEESSKSKGKSSVTGRSLKKEKTSDSRSEGESAAAPASTVADESEKNIKNDAYKPNSYAKLNITTKELNAKISEFQKEKGMSKSFTCIISLNADNTVSSVEFENPASLKRSEVKDLREFLKKLTCFTVNPQTGATVYKLSYTAQ